MAGMSEGPVPTAVSESFIGHFMHEPDIVWCDVRFACVAQDMGLALVTQPGLFGNPMDEKEEAEAIQRKGEDSALVFHNVRDHDHMARIHHLVQAQSS